MPHEGQAMIPNTYWKEGTADWWQRRFLRPLFCSQNMWLQFRQSVSRQITPPLSMKGNLSTVHQNSRFIECIYSACFRNIEASDPRDCYYYSLMGVIRVSLQPNYQSTKLVEHVCVDFARAYIEQTRGSRSVLLILHEAAGAKEHERNPGLPSWVLALHLASRRRLPPTRKLQPGWPRGRRRNGGYKPFASYAEGGVFDAADLSQTPWPEVRGTILRVPGVRVDDALSTCENYLSKFLREDVRKLLANHVRRHGRLYSKLDGAAVPVERALLATLPRDATYCDPARDFNPTRPVDADSFRTWLRMIEGYDAA
ncbi:hypothetical protein MAPG_00079 [Magnaporthiopsis poae ATCC 64411]|uniref:Uncharacterized protein n=1 Tax=Magnaporthiopsis poae (strain ATCC 64411 / 73-15) TaxID=644358 RepID=A0A0C4DK16_MAGP6|nr:hypothetical protein MAPG_00079 [Magnaporthiopsis poae ATCC 64411]